MPLPSTMKGTGSLRETGARAIAVDMHEVDRYIPLSNV